MYRSLQNYFRSLKARGAFLMQVIWRPRNASHQCQTRIIGRQKHLFQYWYIWREDQSQQHCQIKSNWSPRNLWQQNWPWHQFAQSHKLVSLNLDFWIVARMHLKMIRCDFCFFLPQKVLLIHVLPPHLVNSCLGTILPQKFKLKIFKD